LAFFVEAFFTCFFVTFFVVGVDCVVWALAATYGIVDAATKDSNANAEISAFMENSWS
jgi:hypothetical protein